MDINEIIIDIKNNIENLKSEHLKELGEVKEVAEKAKAAADQLTTRDKEKADQALLKLATLTEQVTELEQKLSRGIIQSNIAQKSLGEQIVEDEEFKKLFGGLPNSKASYNFEIKADITSAGSDAGAGIAPNRLTGVLELPQQRLTIRNLLASGRTTSPTIQYVRETGFTNNAAIVAEGDLKPQSDIKFDDVNVTTRVIAHWMRPSRQILDDFQQVASIINNRLIYGLELSEEKQLLNGDGTGQNLHGLIPQAAAYKTPEGTTNPTAATVIDTLRLAMLQSYLAEYPVTGHVLNPIDWASIEMLKDGQGRYIIGNPQGTIAPTLWGIPVVQTQAITVNKFLTGAFKLGAQVFDQWTSRVEVGYQNDDFTRNKVTILAEERLALAVYRPEAFVYGSLNPSSASS